MYPPFSKWLQLGRDVAVAETFAALVALYDSFVLQLGRDVAVAETKTYAGKAYQID